MFSTIALIAAAAISPAATPAKLADTGPFDPLTAIHRTKTGEYCIRSGWQSATRDTGRLVRAGACRSAAEWRRRGLVFTPAGTARDTRDRGLTIAAR